MKSNDNLNPLPFYPTIDGQHQNIPQAYGDVYPLICKTLPLLPFQLRREKNGKELTRAEIRYIGANASVVNVLSRIRPDITIVEDGEYENIIYTAATTKYSLPIIGRAYLYLSDGTNEWYSELFSMVDNLEGYLRLEWRDSVNVNVGEQKIIYEGNTYKNFLYICAQIGMPEYEYTEEGEERDGHFFPLKQISEKVYKFTFVAPEYMCDALRLVPLADEVVITDAFGVRYECENILVTPSWLEQGNLARVDVEIHTDTICKKIGKGYDSTNN